MLTENNTAIILYHKNISNIYKERWIQKCLNSIASQTFQGFDVLELCYGNNKESLSAFTAPQLWNNQGRLLYQHIPMENHVHAMNWLLDYSFLFIHYDAVFNINLDDFYDHERFEYQLHYIKNYDIISSNMIYIEETEGGIDRPCKGQPIVLSDTDIGERLSIAWNVIAHPCVCYTRNFWVNHGKYEVDKIPKEDLLLWQKAYKNGAKMFIIPKSLLFYRIHNNQICATTR